MVCLLNLIFSVVADYIDMAKTQIMVKAKIVRSNGDDLDANDQVGPVNLTLHSLFSEVDLKLNDTQINSANNTYAYRAYLETLLSYGPDAKDSQLTAALYYKDTAGHLDVTHTTGNGATNAGLAKRQSFFADGRVVDMIGNLHSEICAQERLIPSDVGLRVRLIRNKDAFCLMSQNADYKMQIIECKLLIHKVKVSPSVFIAHAKALERSNAKYPLRRVIVKTFTVSAGNLDFSQENLFSGQLPNRLVIGFVENEAFNGVCRKNPFHFKHFDLTQLKVYIDGQQNQQVAPLEVNFQNNQYIQAYLSIFQGLNKLGRDEGIDISREDYASGYTLFAFDLSPDRDDCGTLNLTREGTVRLDAKFQSQLQTTINVVVYAEFQNLLEIDRSKNILFDYST